MVVVVVVLGGCASERPIDEVVPGAPSPSATFINGGPCPLADPSFPTDAGCVTTGEDGALSVYAILDEETFPRHWRIRLDAGGRVIDQPLEAGNRFSYPRAIAGIDINGDSVREWLIKAVDLASHGTNWQRLEFFVATDESLEPTTIDGEPLWVNVGGTSRMGEGARCDGEHFVLLRTEAENRKNTRWSFSERTYEIDGTEATLLDRRTGEHHLSDYNDPQLDPYYQVTCGTFVYP